jgi:L-amino acid N-acyltransferase YncA
MTIRELNKEDGAAVKLIYEQGIATKNATFETTAPDWEEWDKKYMKECRFAAVNGDEMLGWAALTMVSGRCVYAGVCEVSVYIHKDHQGKGIGKNLLKELITGSEQNNIWTLQAGIFPENAASIKIHLKLGFREVGRREKIGKMDGVWRDTVLLERRSSITGVN